MPAPAIPAAADSAAVAPALTVAPPAPDTRRTYRLATPIQVTAPRAYTAASDASFRAADFELRPRRSTQDMLRIVPGLVISQHAGGGKAEQIFMRGFDADHGTDVNISVDDAPVNMVSHGHGQGYADLHFIIPETIERVDVVKGPYLARYGDLTTAGAVAFVTADSIASNVVKLEAGTFETLRALGLFRAPIGNPNVKAYYGAEINATQGPFEAQQDFLRANLFGKVRFGVGQGALTASVSTMTSGWDASGQVPERAIAAGTIGRFGAIDRNEGGNTSRTTAVLRYHTGGNAPFLVTGSYTNYRFRLFSDFTFFLVDSLRGDMIEQTDKRQIVALKAERELPVVRSNYLLRTRFGANLRADDIDVALYRDSVRTRHTTTVDTRIAQRQVGGFVEEEIVMRRVRALLGLRVDYFNVDVENRLQTGGEPDGVDQEVALSPKANVAFNLPRHTTLFLNSGLGFHSNDARAVVSERTDRILPRAFGSEIGVRYGRPRSRLAASAAAWMLALESELVWVGDEGTTEASGRTLRQGIDLELQVRPLDWLALSADATLSHGRFRDLPDGEDHIPLAPEMTLTANAVARFDPWSGALRLRHVDERPANETNTIRALGYTVFDLAATLERGSREYSLTIENLFDRTWNEAQFATESRLRDEPAPVDELHFTPGTPFALRLGVAQRF
jgi:outer membrane receptor protein involved in Fe transport